MSGSFPADRFHPSKISAEHVAYLYQLQLSKWPCVKNGRHTLIIKDSYRFVKVGMKKTPKIHDVYWKIQFIGFLMCCFMSLLFSSLWWPTLRSSDQTMRLQIDTQDGRISNGLPCQEEIQRWMEEILHQLIGGLYNCLSGFDHPRWCRISSIHSSSSDDDLLWFVTNQWRKILGKLMCQNAS